MCWGATGWTGALVLLCLRIAALFLPELMKVQSMGMGWKEMVEQSPKPPFQYLSLTLRKDGPVVREAGGGGREWEIWAQFLAVQQTSCVTMGNSSSLAGPPFPICDKVTALSCLGGVVKGSYLMMGLLAASYSRRHLAEHDRPAANVMAAQD